MKECMTDPTASACTDTYGSRFLAPPLNNPSFRVRVFGFIFNFSSNLPTILAAKCDGTTCTTLTTDLDVVKECFKGKKNYLSYQYVKHFFPDPTAAACTGTYSDSDGTMLPSVLASKCSSTTCTSLTTSVTNLGEGSRPPPKKKSLDDGTCPKSETPTTHTKDSKREFSQKNRIF